MASVCSQAAAVVEGGPFGDPSETREDAEKNTLESVAGDSSKYISLSGDTLYVDWASAFVAKRPR